MSLRAINAALHNPEATGYIFRASVTIKGVTYYARDYGHKAFKIPV